MKTFLTDLVRSLTKPAARTAPAAPRQTLGVERLESRENPSSYVNTSGDLVVLGTNGPDNIQITQESIGWGQYYHVNENGNHAYYPTRSVWGGDVEVYAYDGHDYVNNWAGNLNLIARGGNGNDVLIGDAGMDRLYGGDGQDWLYGYGGNDYMFGDYGDDHMFGGDGNDNLQGHYGTDTLYGEAGNDELSGGYDGVRDYLTGGTGYDRFHREMHSGGWFYSDYNLDTPSDFGSGDWYL